MIKKWEIVITIAAVLISIAVISMTSIFILPARDNGNHQNSGDIEVSSDTFGLGQAIKRCDEQIALNFGDRITSKNYENLPNDANKGSGAFRLFAKLEVNQDQEGEIKKYDVVCTIAALANRIEVFEIEQSKGRKITDFRSE